MGIVFNVPNNPEDFHHYYEELQLNSSHNLSSIFYRNDSQIFYGYNDDILYDPWAKFILSSVYIIIFIIGVTGNFLICFVILREKFLSISNLFILQLALSDILLCLVCLPFTPIYFYLQNWIFGKLLCVFLPAAQGTSVYISTLTLTAIAIDRYFVIIHPFKQRMKISTCFLIILAIWIFALIATSPYGYFMKYETTGNNENTCVEDWPSPKFRHIFSLATVLMQFILPVLIITFCYTKICIKLKDRARVKSNNNSNNTASRGSFSVNKNKSLRRECLDHNRKRRTNRMLILMCSLFVLSWCPISLFNISNDFFLESSYFEYRYTNLLFFTAHSIAMSSVCYNFFLYGFCNENFRKEFELMLPCYFNANNTNPAGLRSFENTNIRKFSVNPNQLDHSGSRQKNKRKSKRERIQSIPEERSGFNKTKENGNGENVEEIILIHHQQHQAKAGSKNAEREGQGALTETSFNENKNCNKNLLREINSQGTLLENKCGREREDIVLIKNVSQCEEKGKELFRESEEHFV